MVSRVLKLSLLVAGLALTFFSVSLVLARLIPPPHGSTDHLVIGSCATLVCLLLVLAASVQGSYRT
jgi:hypothetical protein